MYISYNAYMHVLEKKTAKCPPVSACVAEAEELNNRLQSSKQRVSELERTLSSVSTQQKQFEKVRDTMIISKNIKWNMLTVTLGHNSVFKLSGNISTFLKWYVLVVSSVSVAQQRTWKGERQPKTGAFSAKVGHLLCKPCHKINVHLFWFSDS